MAGMVVTGPGMPVGWGGPGTGIAPTGGRPPVGQPNHVAPQGTPQVGAPLPLPPRGVQPNPMPPQPTTGNPLPGTALPNALPPQARAGAPVTGVMTAPGVPLLVPNGLNAVTITAPQSQLPGVAPNGQGRPGTPVQTSVPAQVANVLLARQPANAPVVPPMQGLANPRAEAAAAALRGPAQPTTVVPTAAAPNPTAAQAGAAVVAPAALAGRSSGPPVAVAANAPAVVQASQVAAARQAAAAPGSAQAVAQAQTALALALGKVAAGQTTAGTGAMALAEAQLNLRASKLALTQAQLAAQSQRLGGQGAGTTGPATTAAAALAGARQPVPAGAMPRTAGATAPGQVPMGGQAQPTRAVQSPQTRTAQAQVQTQAGAKAREPAPAPAAAQAHVAMPRALAAALAMAPKLRKRGSYDRVEAVDRDTPRREAPEMEDEDFWDFWDGRGDEGDWDGTAQGLTDETAEAEAEADLQRQAAAQAAAQHYRLMRAWLVANEQHALLRELAAGRRVLVWAPPDKTRLRLLGHLLRPDAPAVGQAGAVPTEPGTTGRAWAVAARWSATLPADTQWRVWRLRQGMDTQGVWHIGASQPDRHTPRLLTAGDAGTAEAAPVGEAIAVHEPRRLRRLMGTQWTLTVLRVPVPLNDSAPAPVVAEA